MATRSMIKPRKIAGLAIASLALSFVPAAAAVPAQAALPSCLQVYTPGDRVQVTNGCDSAERVKIVWAYGSDSACTVVNSLDTEFFTKPLPFSRFDGAQDC